MLLSTKREVKFGGPRSSQEFNDWAQKVVEDLYHLYQIVVKNDQALPEDYLALTLENVALQQRISELESQLASLSQAVGTGNKVLYRFFSDPSGIIYPSERAAEVEAQFGVAHGSVRSRVSKVFLVDEAGNPHLPAETKVRAYVSTSPIPVPDLSGAELIADDTAALRGAVDGNRRTYWLQEVRKDNTVSQLYVAIHLQLPPVYAHQLVNTLTIRPLPPYQMSLLDVWLKGPGEWFRPSTYPMRSDPGFVGPMEKHKLGDIRISFPESDVLECIVYFSQPFWFNGDGGRIFPIGLRELNLELVRYHSTSSLRIPFTIPSPDVSFEEITGIDVGLSFASPSGPDQVTATLLVNGSPYDLHTQLPALTKTVEVELTFRVPDASPLVEYVALHYLYA